VNVPIKSSGPTTREKKLRAAAHGAVTSAFEPHDVRRDCRVRRGSAEIDGAAECRRPVREAIAAFVNFGGLERERDAAAPAPKEKGVHISVLIK
jgi:hypothetical protein